MTENIEKRSKELLDEVKNQSLKSKMNSLRDKIQVMRRFSNNVLLCDVSGSMDSLVGIDKEAVKAIDVVNEVLESFIGAKIYKFSISCSIVKSGTKLHTESSTNMAGAFNKVKADGHNEIILITDGAPDSENLALTAAQDLTIKIIYIGPAPTPSFLVKLGRLNQNKIESIELIKLGRAATKEIENRIKGFLNA